MGNGNTGFAGINNGAYASVFTPEAYGARGDNVTVDNTAVQSAFDAATAKYASTGAQQYVWLSSTYLLNIGGSSVTPPGYHAIYYALLAKAGVTVAGPGGFRCPYLAATNQAVIADGGSADRFTLDGIGLDGGSGATVEQEQFGLLVTTSSDVTARGCHATNFRSKAFMQISTAGQEAQRVRFVDNKADNAAGNFIGLVYAQNSEVSRNFLVGPVPSGGESIIGSNLTDVQIYDNIIVDGGAIAVTTATRVQIVGNDITWAIGPSSGAIELNSGISKDCLIAGNAIDFSSGTGGNDSCGIMANGGGTGFNRLRVIGNDITVGTGTNIFGIQLVSVTGSSSDVTVADNVTDGAIQVQGGTLSNVGITGNVVNGAGISTSAITGGTVTGNTVTASGNAGLLFLSGTNLTVGDNAVIGTATSSGVYPITIGGSGHTISGNVFVGATPDNSSAVVGISGLTNSIISANRISNNGAGFLSFWEQNGAAGNAYYDNFCDHNGNAVGAAGFQSLSATSIIRNNPGANPVGVETVAVPAAATDVSAVNHDRVYYITAGAAATQIWVGPIHTGESEVLNMPASSTATVHVPATWLIQWDGTTAPTWVVIGE